jgi:hypothetical protein
MGLKKVAACYMGHPSTAATTKQSKSGTSCKICARINDRLRYCRPKSADCRPVRAQ